MKIVADKDIPFVEHYFADCGELVLISGRTLKREQLLDADILLSRSVTPINRELLEDTPVRFVACVSTAENHIDNVWLDAKKIGWCTAAGFNATPVVEYVVSVIAALQKNNLLQPKNLRAGVIGVGRIGSQVVEKLKLLGFSVVMCDPIRAEREPDFISKALENFTDLDLITLHVPLTWDGAYPTYHFINRKFLQRQKTGAVLINAARGSVIDSEDFKIAGTQLHACFDVWENEPRIDKKILQQALIATPHIAGYSVQSKYRGTEMIYNKLRAAKIISATAKSSLPLPHLRLDALQDWRDVVLQVFNPSKLTAEMKQRLLNKNDDGTVFDTMRREFIHRHEFAYVDLADLKVSQADRWLLQKLGFLF